MATSAIAGYNGSVDIGGAVAEVFNLDWDELAEALDATSFDSTSNFREFVPGLLGGNGSFESFTADIATGAHAAATFSIAGGRSASGKIVITRKGTGSPVDGLQTIAYDFTFNGVIS